MGVETAARNSCTQLVDYQLPSMLIRDEELGGLPVISTAVAPSFVPDAKDHVLDALCGVAQSTDPQSILVNASKTLAASAGFGSVLEALARYSARL